MVHIATEKLESWYSCGWLWSEGAESDNNKYWIFKNTYKMSKILPFETEREHYLESLYRYRTSKTEHNLGNTKFFILFKVNTYI